MTDVAVDGPAGAGKSTIARGAAKKLGFLYVDTGALYRAIGLFMLKKGIDPADPEKVVPLLSNLSVSLEYKNGEQCVILCGEDVSGQIRSPEVSMASSKVSAIPAVRAFLLDLQRDLAKTNNVIMDGRDIGTVVLPDAQVKVFLTASVEIRAQRRYKEMVQKGMSVKYEDVLNDVKQRDYNDTHRAAAPLKAAEGSVRLDTSEINLEESIAQLVKIIRTAAKEK